MSRVRYSLQEIQNKYDTGEDRTPLENLVRAFRAIERLPPTDPNSFFFIAGFHGEPFRGPGVTDGNWWGGYCNHGNVLFPTWHRALLFRLENALRKIPGCQDVTLPFWDECLGLGNDNPQPIPTVLTTPTFQLDGGDWNPLYSYTLQQSLVEQMSDAHERYSKHAGYQTVRFPLSGLVGTDADRQSTEMHNASYEDMKKRTSILNANVANWLGGKIDIEAPSGDSPKIPDTYSVMSQYKLCLDAPNYTVFSNKTSAQDWIAKHCSHDPHYVVALESPHNAIHLAVGGMYQKGVYDADPLPVLGANGDMGENETASFDPIFYFHHCFIDYVFWMWQKKNKLTDAGSLTLLEDDPGRVLQVGQAGLPPGTVLDMKTPLYPFQKKDDPRKPDEAWYTSYDVTDIEQQLGYTYGPGSLTPVIDRRRPLLGEPGMAPIVAMKRVHNINRAQYPGSFVIRTYAKAPEGKEVEIARDAILSRWNVQGCANCQNKLKVESMVPLDSTLLSALRGKGRDEDVHYRVVIHTHDMVEAPLKGGKGPIIEHLGNN